MKGQFYAFYVSRKFPLSILIIFLAGIFWLLFDFFFKDLNFTPCLFKNVKGYACPACGTTRAFDAFFHGKLMQSFIYNPLWVVILLLAILVLPAMFLDLVFGSQNLQVRIKKFDNYFSKKPYLLLFFGILIVVNWYWNLLKY